MNDFVDEVAKMIRHHDYRGSVVVARDVIRRAAKALDDHYCPDGGTCDPAMWLRQQAGR